MMPIERIDGLQIDLSNYGRSRRDLLRNFMKAIYPLVEEINQAIDTYNALDKSWGAWLMPAAYLDEKAEHLALIESKIKAMHDAQSDDDLVCCPDYFDKIQTKLFRDIQAERQKLHQEAEEEADKAPVTLSEIIAEMDPEKANQLTGILVNKKGDALRDALRGLYQPGEAGEEVFFVFLDTHTITALSSNNSKNFKVVNKKTNEAQVLKIDNRLGQPKTTEVYLRNDALPGVFTGIFADRAVIYQNEKTKALESRGLQVTEFCPGSDVAAYGGGLDDEIKEESAVNIYMQMVAILKETESNQSFFPDIKNTNWLIDASGRVRVADGKSLVFSDLNGNIDARRSLIHTPFISAPEMRARPPSTFSADKAHAYMLGKDLYQYLTACSRHDFYKKAADGSEEIISDASELDFSYAIFNTSKGAAFKQLIEDTVKTNPDERLSLAAVEARMQAIDPNYEDVESRQIERLYKRCWAHLSALEQLAISAVDNKMVVFLTEQAALLGQHLPVQDLVQLDKKLRSMQENLEVISSGVQQEITRLNQQSMAKEADILEYLMCDMSLEARQNIIAFDAPEAKELFQLLEGFDKKEQSKKIDAMPGMTLLRFMKEQKADKDMNRAVARFEALSAQVMLLKLKEDDREIKGLIDEMLKSVGGNPRYDDFESVNQTLEETFLKLKVFSNQIKSEVQLLQETGHDVLATLLLDAAAGLSAMARDNAADFIQSIKAQHAIQQSKAYKQALPGDDDEDVLDQPNPS